MATKAWSIKSINQSISNSLLGTGNGDIGGGAGSRLLRKEKNKMTKETKRRSFGLGCLFWFFFLDMEETSTEE